MVKLLYNTWLYRQPKRKKKKRPKSNKKGADRLAAFATSLEEHLPRSESWFRTLYTPHPKDQYNTPFGPYIPDLINKELRYVIEIDGSIHNREDIKFKDWQKNRFYMNQSYKVFRIVAYNLDSFNKTMAELTTYIEGQLKP